LPLGADEPADDFGGAGAADDALISVELETFAAPTEVDAFGGVAAELEAFGGAAAELDALGGSAALDDFGGVGVEPPTPAKTGHCLSSLRTQPEMAVSSAGH
jgi:hypothetical protein